MKNKIIKHKCSNCGKTKVVNKLNFWADKYTSNGFCGYCKVCGKKWNKIYQDRREARRKR